MRWRVRRLSGTKSSRRVGKLKHTTSRTTNAAVHARVTTLGRGFQNPSSTVAAACRVRRRRSSRRRRRRRRRGTGVKDGEGSSACYRRRYRFVELAKTIVTRRRAASERATFRSFLSAPRSRFARAHACVRYFLQVNRINRRREERARKRIVVIGISERKGGTRERE